MSILSQLQSDPTGFLISFLYRVPAVLIALTLHELAHGYVALKCGDPTAQMLGRLTFNPLKHLDPVGTIFMFLFGIGWARPVPVNPRNFKHFRRDDFWVSIAGIVMNFALFLLSMLAMLLTLKLMFKPSFWQSGIQLATRRDFLSFDGYNFYSLYEGLDELFIYAGEGGGLYCSWAEMSRYLRMPQLRYVQRFWMNAAMVNLGLALFNLLPIPPLDGYHVFNDVLVRGRLHIPERVMNVCMIALLVVCFATDIVSTIISRAIYFVQGGVLSALLWVFGVA